MNLLGNCTYSDPATGQAIVQLNCAHIIVQNLLHWGLIFAGVVALLLVIYGGFRFLTSGGEKEKVAEAQKTLTWALIGLVVVLFAFAAIKFIAGITGVTCLAKPFDFTSCGYQPVSHGPRR